MTPDRQRLFVQTVAAIFQARQEVTDLFFQHRVTECIQAVLETHIQCCLFEDSSSRLQAYLRALRQTDTLFEEVAYLRKGDPIAFAAARERILVYIRTVLQEVKRKPLLRAVVPLSKTESPKNNVLPAKQTLPTTPQKILDFVRQAPERRAKEIVDEFSALSGRTVKRGLKELSEKGLIVRKEQNNAVYYSAVN